MSKTFNIQFDQGEFDLYCPLSGDRLHAFQFCEDKEVESVPCLDCEIEVNVSVDFQKRILTLELNDGQGRKFKNDGKGSKTFNIQFDQGEFDLYCPLCGDWLHAFHFGEDKEVESVPCLDCEIEVNISADFQKRILTLEINEGASWEFKDDGKGSKSGSKN